MVNNMNFSVLMSVYEKEKPDNLRKALDSVMDQTAVPNEIILIRDGKVPQPLQSEIDRYINRYPELFTYIPLDENKGLGNALNIGVKASKYELIARMDSDDISIPDRFEKQLEFIATHPSVSVLGGQISEFYEQPDIPAGKRVVPLNNNGIKKVLRRSNPMNHVTVMFRKSDVLECDNYIHMKNMEDYYLWCRMILAKKQFANLPDVLVNVRTDPGMYRRRGGIEYFKSWKELEAFKLKNGITTVFHYLTTLFMRYVVHVLVGDSVRGWIMRTFSRKK